MKKKLNLLNELNYFDINPLKFRGRGFFQKVEKDKLNYLRKFSKLLTKKKISCPLCKNKKSKIFLKISKKYYLSECSKCNVKFPNVDFLNNNNYSKIIYEKYSHLNHRKNIDKTEKYRIKMMKDKYDFCISRNFKNVKKINILDYGCGSGLFLEYLKKKNINAIGLEIDEVSAEKLTNKKIKFYNDINKIKSNSLDLCVLFDVLEHLTDPIRDLSNIRKKLKKNGKIVIYTPNINSLAFELMGPKQNQVYPFQHIFFFGIKSFHYLSKKTNLKIVDLSTYGLDMMDYFFMKEYLDNRKYFENLKLLINKTQALIDLSGYGNHYRLTLQK